MMFDLNSHLHEQQLAAARTLVDLQIERCDLIEEYWHTDNPVRAREIWELLYPDGSTMRDAAGKAGTPA